jgi:DNA-binding MarR family transcriptional regulator
MTEHAHLELEHFLPYRLSVLSNRISQEIARLYADRFQLNVTEWRLLAVLGRYPDLTATELVERTAMDKVAVSRAVASLVEDGRLTRKVDGDDRRRARLRLSAKGYRIYDEVAPLALQYQQSLLSALSGEDRVLLEALLSRLNVENAA